MADLTSVQQVRGYLGLLGEQNAEMEALLARLVTTATEWFNQETDRVLVRATHTERQIHEGDGRVIIPKQYPVATVTSVTVNDTAIPAATTTTASGWYLVGDLVYLRDYVLDEDDIIDLVYAAGFESIPADLQQAATELVAIKFNERKTLGQSSVSMSGMSMTVLPAFVPRTVQDVVKHYRRLVCA